MAYAGLVIWAAVVLFVVLRPLLALAAGAGLVLGLAVRSVWRLWRDHRRRPVVTGEASRSAVAGRRSLGPGDPIVTVLIGGLAGLLLAAVLLLLTAVPLLLPFAVVGLLGLGLKIRRDRQRGLPKAPQAIQDGHQALRNRRTRWLAIGLVSGVLVGLAFAFAPLARRVEIGSGALPVAVIRPSYVGEATYQDDRWKVTDRVVFSADALTELRDALNQGVAARQAAAIAEQIRDLFRLGWAVDARDDNRWVISPRQGRRPAGLKRIAPLLAKISRKGWSVETDNTKIALIRDRREEIGQTRANDVLLQELSQQGWSVRQVGRGLEFTHSREEGATVRRYPASTTRQLSIALPEGFKGPGGRSLLFEPGEGSTLVLTGHSHLILSTSPEGTYQTGAGRDTVEITLPPTTRGEVDIEMLSPLFRSAIGATLATMSLGGTIKWLVLLGAAVSADELKRLMLVLLRWIQRRLHIPIPEEPV